MSEMPKSCPAGHPAKLWEQHTWMESYSVGCTDEDCTWQIGWFPTKAAAIAAWNQRAGDDAAY